MKICFLNAMHPVFDKRAFFKLGYALRDAGHEVVVIGPGDLSVTHKDGIQIRPFKQFRSRWTRPMVLPKLFVKGMQEKADVYHCNGPDAWVIGVILKVLLRKKVTFDVMEHYPSTFAEWFPAWLRPIVRKSTIVIMRILASCTDHIILTKECLDKEFLGSKTQRTVILNTSYVSDIRRVDYEQSPPHPFRIIHVGLFGRERGSEVLLQALRILKESHIPTLCTIVGTFSDGSEPEFGKLMSELGLQEQIRVIPWIPFHEVPTLIADHHLGLILFQPTRENNILGMPNKLFDYMASGIPTIAPGFAPEIVRVVENANCGVLVDVTNAEALAAALRELRGSPSLLEQLGRNGRAAAETQYNWPTEAKKLAQVFASLVGV